MKKRILSTAIAFALALSVCSAFCLIAQPVSAASKAKGTYMMNRAVEQESSGRYEKIGKYYFWTERYNTTALKCATSISGKAKTLDTAKNDLKISPCMVTDGNQIYYAVNKYKYKDEYDIGTPISSTFYKTSVKGKKKKLITVPSAVDTYAYYNGKLYYGSGNPKPAEKATLYVYDTAKKTTKKLKSNFEGHSSYGKYITYRNQANNKYYIYNVTTGKSKKLPSSRESIVYGKKVYYYTESKSSTTVKSCDLSGRGVKTIKKLNANLYCEYFGRTAAYFKDMDFDLWKFTYKTKKMTKSHR